MNQIRMIKSSQFDDTVIYTVTCDCHVSGHPVDPKYLPKSRTLPNALTTAVIKPEKGEMQGSFIGGSLTSIQNTVGRCSEWF